MTRNDTIIDKAVKALSQSVTSILADPACDKALAMATTFTQCRDFLQRNVVKLAPPNDPDDDELDDIDTTTLPQKLQQAIAALIMAEPQFDRQSAAWYLLHTPHGRALVEHLSKRKDEPMNRTEQLRSIAKDYGVAKLAKHLVADNDAHGITEAELTSLIFEEAKKHMLPGERPNSAFARFYSAPENLELRKAIAIAKNAPLMSIDPVQVGGEDATDVNDAKKAYDQLTALAEEQRKRSPTLSPAQSFARVFEANPDLAARAHQRPTATTSYAFPS